MEPAAIAALAAQGDERFWEEIPRGTYLHFRHLPFGQPIGSWARCIVDEHKQLVPVALVGSQLARMPTIFGQMIEKAEGFRPGLNHIWEASSVLQRDYNNPSSYPRNGGYRATDKARNRLAAALAVLGCFR